jgi:chromosome segregation ATPase
MRRIVLVALVLLAPWPLAAQAPPAAPADPVAAELARLNATLEEIVTLLRRQGDNDELALVIKRVELAEARLAEAERRLAAAEGNRRSLETEGTQIELRLKMMASEIEQRGGDVPAAEVEAMTTAMEAELRRMRQRAGEVASEIAALEGEVATRRREVEEWKTLLDRRLGSR